MNMVTPGTQGNFLKIIPFILCVSFFLSIATFPGVAESQQTKESRSAKNLVVTEMQRAQHLNAGRSVKSMASTWFHVNYYNLNLTISTSPIYLSGVVMIRGRCDQDGPRSLTLDLTNNMRIDSIKITGIASRFVQGPAAFTVLLDSGYHSGDDITLRVYYQGLPQSTGFGSFVFGAHSGTPWVWSLSEPYGAKDWWPCKDHPSEKADSVDIIVTADSSFTVGSNGKLVSEIVNADGTKTTHWKELYPIETYLVSVAMTNFSRFSNWFHYSATDSMEVLNYVLPESLSSARSQLSHAVDGLEIFSNLFGLYPFIKEKYGHSEFGSGGMEHQTMTSIGTFDEETVIHELAHQWFGDMITCASWSHLWLNEGFATYCTALYKEVKYGVGSYKNFIAFHQDQARRARGTVVTQDTSDVRQLFDGPRTYSKGACVLHMLRHVLGDSVFFKSMHAYANHPSLRFRTATTEDFRAVCEQTSGKDLRYFFDEWIYGESFPRYLYSWNVRDSSGTRLLTVGINQTTGTTNPSFFTMPIDLRIMSRSWDTTVAILNNMPEQVFSFVIRHAIDSVQFDIDDWILKSAIRVPSISLPTAFSLFQNYPNPFNSSTIIRYTLHHRSEVSLSIFNLLGQKVATLVSGTQFMGTYTTHWTATGCSSGLYFLRLDVESTTDRAEIFTQVRKLLLLK